MKKRSRVLSSFLFWVGRRLLSLRYKVTVIGKDKISSEKGMLFLPNHPAEIDPVLIMSYIGTKYFPRPMVVEHFYRLKGFQWILDLVGVTPIPTMEEKANIWRGKEVAKIFSDVLEQIKAGDSFLIYPAGKLKNTGKEQIGGASFVHSLLTACPDIPVVLVRTTGLWGSSFSKAPTGRSPNFGKTLLANFIRLVKNGIFFIPRRSVLVEICAAPSDLPAKGSRLEFNKYLEEWYNRYPEVGPEPLKLVSYSFYKDDFIPMSHALPAGDVLEENEHIDIPQQVEKEIKEELSILAKIPVDKIHRRSNLSSDLGLDSLDIANIHIFLDRRYDVSEFTPGDLQTLEDILLAVSGQKKKKSDAVKKETHSFFWPGEPLRKRVHAPQGKTIQEAFLSICENMGGSVAAADALLGKLSYRRMKIAALALAKKIEDIPGSRVGIMLPSSVSAYITILAVLFARKVPVMFNWTAGVRGLDHARDVSKASSVITSRLFLDKAGLRSLGSIEDKLVYLEDIRHGMTVKDKLRAFKLSLKKTSSMLQELKLHTLSASDPAVVLFTSGTEALPKAVSLSHENIIFDQTSALSCIKFKRKDCLFAVLPPFHSFGFSITGLMPLLCGMKVYYSPDPNSTHTMLEEIVKVRPTIFVCAPSFIRSLFSVAEPQDLSSLRLVVSGAEKAPQQLRDYVRLNLPRAEFLEGYGITECSPVVTLCRPGEMPIGVGKPLPGIELAVVDPTTRQPLPQGTEGQVCIRGANVFAGYLSPANTDPFIEIDQQKWYLSGDMGRVDDRGNLHLTGRVKRFVKVGGEMVSLGGLEEEIYSFAFKNKLVDAQGKGSPLALTIKEKEAEKPELILFTTFPAAREEINAFLKDAGWGRIIKISQVHQIGEIPLTGVGKTDYRLLDEKYLSGLT